MPPIHRTIKNVVKNYSYAEVKVREATSNDPWGPSTSLMAEIAELTYDLAAFIEIMAMIWKRINDHGKNWRHVYKALVLLEYLTRYGQEGVATQCKENLVAIKTLRDFQHMEDGKDQGHSVREKAKQLVALLTDGEKLRSERSKASGTRSKFGYMASERSDFNSSPVLGRERYSPNTPSSYAASSERPKERVPIPTTNRLETYNTYMQNEKPRPSPQASPRPRRCNEAGSNDDDVQLQLALAMSREQHEEEERLRKGDEIKLQMAIEESKKTAAMREKMYSYYSNGHSKSPSSRLDSSLVDPWSGSTNQKQDPWGDKSPLDKEPWEIIASADHVRSRELKKVENGSKAAGRRFEDDDEFSEMDDRYKEQQIEKNQSIETWLNNNLTVSDKKEEDLWRNGSDGGSDISDIDKPIDSKPAAKKVTPEQFLGAHAKLVDFDDLMSKPAPASILNPFAITIGKGAPAVNPFTAKAQEEERSKKVPLNQLAPSNDFGGAVAPNPTPMWSGPPPTAVAVVYTAGPPMVQSSPGYNPFL